MKLKSGSDAIVAHCCDHIIIVIGDEFQAVLAKVTYSEALELAAELVKLAMPEANKEKEANATTS